MGDWLFVEKGIVKKNFDPLEGNSSQEISDILFDHNGTLWFFNFKLMASTTFSNERLYRPG